jgi:type IV pilus assembly protein PilO
LNPWYVENELYNREEGPVMNLRDPKIQRLLLIILVVVVGGYIYFGSSLFSFCYMPRKARIESMEKEYAKLSAELEKARKTVGNLAQLEAEYQKLHDQWISAQQLLPEEKEMPDLLRKVTTAGNKAGVKFLLFQPLPPVQKEFYTSHPIKIAVRGGYHHLGIFLSRLANMQRIVNVSNLNLTTASKSRKRDQQSSATVTANFTLTAYTLLGGAQNDTAE